MSELGTILALWRDAKARGDEWVLATVVRVEGSSYRKPGARMLVTATGRAGTISGGCLEAEVVRKAFWLTERGSTVETYQSSFDEDGSAPFGLGCGGTVSILMERGESGEAVLRAMEESFSRRTSSAIVTVIDTNSRLLSRRVILYEGGPMVGDLSQDSALLPIAQSTLADQRSSSRSVTLAGQAVDVFAEYLARVPSLIVFGAGDDAQPVAKAASALGWLVTVADGRVNLLRPERFPLGTLLLTTDATDPLLGINIERTDAAILMTHSYQQDRAALAALLQTSLAYIGVLGPRHRTARLIADAGSAAGLDREECIRRLHSPVGLDLGADSPAAIALAIIAEVHSVLKGRNAAPLSDQTARHPEMTTPIEA